MMVNTLQKMGLKKKTTLAQKTPFSVCNAVENKTGKVEKISHRKQIPVFLDNYPRKNISRGNIPPVRIDSQ